MHIHRYKTIKNTGKWSYDQCSKCFKRRIQQVSSGGYQPVCRSWIKTGTFPDPPTIAPKKPKDTARSTHVIIREITKECDLLKIRLKQEEEAHRSWKRAFLKESAKP